MMIISKYGFSDILAVHNVGLDPSRIAAGVVTAIGFLGAGIIFVHNQSVSGLTTAAGIWATVGVGMSVGGGQYLIGIFSTILLTLCSGSCTVILSGSKRHGGSDYPETAQWP